MRTNGAAGSASGGRSRTPIAVFAICLAIVAVALLGNSCSVLSRCAPAAVLCCAGKTAWQALNMTGYLKTGGIACVVRQTGLMLFMGSITLTPTDRGGHSGKYQYHWRLPSCSCPLRQRCKTLSSSALNITCNLRCRRGDPVQLVTLTQQQVGALAAAGQLDEDATASAQLAGTAGEESSGGSTDGGTAAGSTVNGGGGGGSDGNAASKPGSPLSSEEQASALAKFLGLARMQRLINLQSMAAPSAATRKRQPASADPLAWLSGADQAVDAGISGGTAGADDSTAVQCDCSVPEVVQMSEAEARKHGHNYLAICLAVKVRLCCACHTTVRPMQRCGAHWLLLLAKGVSHDLHPSFVKAHRCEYAGAAPGHERVGGTSPGRGRR